MYPVVSFLCHEVMTLTIDGDKERDGAETEDMQTCISFWAYSGQPAEVAPNGRVVLRFRNYIYSNELPRYLHFSFHFNVALLLHRDKSQI